MLVEVRGNDRLGLHVYKVFSSVGFYAQREVGVRVDVPEGFAEDCWRPVEGAEGGVAGSLD